MRVMERLIQTIAEDKWDDLEELEKKWAAAEARLGYPPKKRYRAWAGTLGGNTLIIEREWSGMAEMEATYEKAFQDPEIIALVEDTPSIVTGNRTELYGVL